MSAHQRFHIRSLDQLRDEIRRLAVDIPVVESPAVLGQPLAVGGKRVPNRLAVQPMEGFDSLPNGAPGPLSFRRYKRYATAGAGLIWFEATAVLDEARSNPGQLCLHKGSVATFRELVDTVRRDARGRFGFEPALVIQLTHSGRYSKPTGVPAPIIAHHSPILDPQHKLPPDYPLVSDDYLDRLQETYVQAAALAAEAGFDGVDIKSCHRYLISELHASFTREGKYGGSFENRTRMLTETLAGIRSGVPGLFITTRMNAYDGFRYPYGFGVNRDDERRPDLAEPIELAKRLSALGAPLLNVTTGNPYFNAHLGRPYDFSIQGVPPAAEHPLEGLARFIAVVRGVQEACPGLPVIGAGYSWLRHFFPHVAAAVIGKGWATMVGIGRGAFAYPEAVRDILETGRMDPAKCCVACSGCTQIMRDGAMTGCVVRDSEIYGPQYRLGRRFALDRLQDEARKCRDCEEATCTRACPAHVNVPAFIKAFADGDIRKAYDVLRESNLLPEMCAYVCPSEVQCEGGCLEKIFCEHPIPIRDIQLLTCKLARRNGFTGVRLPGLSTGKRVAVVGAGPAGLAGAIRLLEQGHSVTLLERGAEFGGTPTTVIPGDRYGDAQTEAEAILKPALAAGRLDVKFGWELGESARGVATPPSPLPSPAEGRGKRDHLSPGGRGRTAVGGPGEGGGRATGISLSALVRDYDAVLLAIGLSGSTSLGYAPGVFDALSFLKQAKSGEVKSIPVRVAVLGGGNTAMDAAVTARKLGARDVYLVYRRSFAEMPAWPAEREKFMASGGHCLILTQPLGYERGPDGKLAGLRIARTELGEPDASGRRRPQVLPQTESLLEVGMVIEALGQQIPEELKVHLQPLQFTKDGRVKTVAPDSCATGYGRVYVAGDLLNGGTTAVQGVAEGMKAAAEIGARFKA